MTSFEHIPALEAQTVEAIRDLEAPVVVACSGGADSSLLVFLASAAGVPARVVNVHHGLVDSADEGSARAAAVAERCGLGFLRIDVDGGRIRADRRGVEAAARAARYAALADVIAPGEIVLTAHTATDRLATLLMRLVQGAGLPALGGPSERAKVLGVEVARPMLRWWREDVRNALASRGWVPWEDPDNASMQRLRNVVERDAVAPLLALAEPEALSRSLVQVARDAAELEAWRRDALGGVARWGDGENLYIGRAGFAALDSDRRAGVMSVALRDLGVRASRTMIERFTDATLTGKAATGRGARLEATRTFVRVKAVAQSREPLPLHVPPVAEIPVEEGSQVTVRTCWGDLEVAPWSGEWPVRSRGEAVVATAEVRGALRLVSGWSPSGPGITVRDDEGTLWTSGGARSPRARVESGADRDAVFLRWRWLGAG